MREERYRGRVIERKGDRSRGENSKKKKEKREGERMIMRDK